MTILVNGLSKQYEYYRKEVGLRHSLRNLFRRERLFREAVRGLSFEVEEGEIVGFLGPNGAGKTTTLKMLSGILHPTGGSAQVMGYVPWERKKEFKKQFSVVMGQKNQLWWDLPASESLYLNKCIYEIEDRDYEAFLDELTEMLDVKPLLNVQVRRLSLGERMKFELIAALIHRPKVLFLDEPTIGLDVFSQRKIREFLKQYNQETRTTILLTSHYLTDIQDLCKRSIVINNGDIVFDGSLQRVGELMDDRKIVTLTFSSRVPQNELTFLGSLQEYDGTRAVIRLDKAEIKPYTRRALDVWPVVDMTIEDIPLEESIMAIYRGKAEAL